MIDVLSAALSALGPAASIFSQSITKAPGAAGNGMTFTKDSTIEDTFRRGESPWMQSISGSQRPQFSLGLQQPANQQITMREMFG